MAQKVKTIKCFAFYDTLDSRDERMNNPAAFTKSSYIFECFQALGYKVDILSASGVVGKKGAKGRKRTIGDGMSLRTLTSFGRGSRLKNAITRIPFMVNMFFKLLFFVKKGDMLWVYHSLPLMKYVKFLKKVKKFKLISEVEEIYGDVLKSQKTINRELDYFKCADAYIFCTGLLSKPANPLGKPEAVSHGSYKVIPEMSGSFEDDKIHVVYAGTLCTEKGGVYSAVSSGLFLDSRYHLHILGSGTDSEVKRVKALIKSVSEKSECKVTYDGAFYGKKYYEFLQKCHIGLSTQNPYEPFNNSSFPSKVLVYMANGLRVVSVRIPAIEQSAVGEYMCFYDNPDPEKIAGTIKSVDLNSGYDGRKIIERIHEDFLEDLKVLLDSI